MSGETQTDPSPGLSVRVLRFGLKLLLALVPLLVLLGLTELGFRLAGVGRPEVKPVWEPHTRSVERTAPDGRKSVYREKILAGAAISLNELGYRDWLYREPKPEGEIRVAGLGDSNTYGQGVEADETWVRRLGAGLAELAPPGRTARTLNFGRLGANTMDELEMLESDVFRFDPDLVVLGFTLYNDAETRAAYQKAGVERKKRKASLIHRIVGWFRSNSFAANHVLTVARRGRNRAAMREHVESQFSDDAPGYVACRESLAGIARACRTRGVPLIVFVFPVHHDDVGLNVWSEYDLGHVHEKLRQVLAPFPEVTFIDPVQGLDTLSGVKIWVDGDGHPNARYQARIAEIILPRVAESLGFERR